MTKEEKLQHWLKENDINRKVFADNLGMSYSTVTMQLNRKITIGMIDCLAEHYSDKIDFNWLLKNNYDLNKNNYEFESKLDIGVNENKMSYKAIPENKVELSIKLHQLADALLLL